ncbi:Chaperone protein DnaK [Planctomycetes bacterium Poly30]|uniref:Chaperone protein DnaK n=1 Tax=Saltatorellus ferox TaxID=2528018 RepID=A0A518ETE2_9BACT|nr:Chaperone protein DnaK [Planctomycetes bacterium Poly30]
MSDSDKIYGIDLGTTCSAIGAIVEGRPRLFEIEGSRLVPSVVTFGEEGVLVGQTAQNQRLLAPERTLASTKRRIGTGHVFDVDGREVTPKEAATEILRFLADEVERQSGERPRRVVVTVPAWFPQDARSETRNAAEAAGLEVVRLVNEPTAAALMHSFEDSTERLSLVYDFGGGTFDASLVQCSGELVEVKASNGDVHLGGDDLDGALVMGLLQDLREEDPGFAAAIQKSPGARQRFLAAVRDAKHELSNSLEATVRAPFLLDLDGTPKHLELPLDRRVLEEALEPLLERTFECVDRVLAEGGVEARDVDEVLLVGGTSRIPAVQEALQKRYGWEGDASVPAQEAVALGATLQAGIIEGGPIQSILLDVAVYPLAIAAVEPSMSAGSPDHFVSSIITPRNAPLPSRHTQRFHTTHPTQRELRIPVLQGGDPNPLRNTPLGVVVINDLPPAPGGKLQRPIAVEFRHDLSGLVSIRVTDEISGRSVDGQVVVGGAESEEARADLWVAIKEENMVPGDGTDPDPYLKQDVDWRATADDLERWEDEGDVPSTTTVSGDGAPLTEDLREAKDSFEQFLKHEKKVAREFPDAAAELAKTAGAGLVAVKGGDRETALQHYDELSDRMFALGIYL